jgi:hypothetical protein
LIHHHALAADRCNLFISQCPAHSRGAQPLFDLCMIARVVNLAGEEREPFAHFPQHIFDLQSSSQISCGNHIRYTVKHKWYDDIVDRRNDK